MELDGINFFLIANFHVKGHWFHVSFPARGGTQTFLSLFRSVRAFAASPWTWKSLLERAHLPLCPPHTTHSSPPVLVTGVFPQLPWGFDSSRDQAAPSWPPSPAVPTYTHLSPTSKCPVTPRGQAAHAPPPPRAALSGKVLPGNRGRRNR